MAAKFLFNFNAKILSAQKFQAAFKTITQSVSTSTAFWLNSISFARVAYLKHHF